MHITHRPDMAVRVAVRRTQWQRLMYAAGLERQEDQAAALGMNRSTLSRMWAGTTAPSADLIARTLATLGCRFEDVFEVAPPLRARARSRSAA